MRYILASLFVVLSFSFTKVHAQRCDVTFIASQIENYAQSMSDEPYPLTLFDDMATLIPSYEASCAEGQDQSATLPEPELGLAFSLEGEGRGENEVLEDLEIPDGFYRVQFVTHGQISFEFQRSTSQCYKSPIPFFYAYPGNAVKGMELLFVAKACRDELSIFAESEWRLDFYPLSIFDFGFLKASYSSEKEGLSPVIGPVKIPDGQYLVTLVNEEGINVNFERISGTCDLWHDRFDVQFFPRATYALPRAETLLTAEDCTGFFTFGSAQTPWTLAFELLP